MQRALIVILWLLLPLAGCTTLYIPPTPTQFHYQAPTQRQAQLRTLHQWRISGALSIQTHQHTHILRYQWTQHANTSRITLHAALNLAEWQLIAKPHYLDIQQGNHRWQSDQPQTFLQKQLGWQLPLDALSHWIKGMPLPGKHQAHYDSWGHLVRLSQRGWQVQWLRYQCINGIDLPQMLIIKGHSLKIRIAIKQWWLHTANKLTSTNVS